LIFDYSSDAAFSALLQTGARKARLQAEWAMTALDRFEACANADWHARVHFDRVGFFGFSFGGATAAEAGTFDPRVVAVANLDGSLMGHAAFGALEKPYMLSSPGTISFQARDSSGLPTLTREISPHSSSAICVRKCG
jgi:dienelactone hydrolase